MTPHKLFRVGITGSVLTGVRCFTPLLVTTFRAPLRIGELPEDIV